MNTKIKTGPSTPINWAPWRASATQEPDAEINAEHGALTRHIAALQRRVTQQMIAYEHKISALESEAVQLRANLVLTRTSLLWNLKHEAIVHTRVWRKPVSSNTHHLLACEQTQTVLCQTGCVGHAHPWLESDGSCRRTGQACEHVSSALGSGAPAESGER